MRRLGTLVAVAVFAAACGNTGGRVLTTPLQSPTPTPSVSQQGSAAPGAAYATPTAVRQAVHTYLDYFFAGNTSAAFQLLSQRCRLGVGEAWMNKLSTSAAAAFGPLTPKHLVVHRIHGDVAVVSYTLSAHGFDAKSQHWRYENGWRLDSC